MRTDQYVNSVINEIMAGDNTCVFLFANEDYAKEDFVSELTGRYFKHFWFSPLLDDMYELCMTLADRIMVDDETTRLRLRQLLFCQSQYNGPKTVIRTVLEYIKNIKREVLVVFENMDLLPKDYDYTLLRYFIINAPRNLKILISASDFIPIGIYGFEPRYPMLIDSKIISHKSDEYDFEEYLAELDDSQIAFLCYVASTDMISDNTIKTFYPEGASVLKYLSRKGVYVCSRERSDIKDYIYVLDGTFRKYLLGIKDRYEKYMGEYASIEVKELIVQALTGIDVNYFDYARYAIKIKSYAHAEKAVYGMLHCPKHIPKIPNFLKAHKEFLKLNPSDKYPYITVLKICSDTIQGTTDEDTLAKIATLKAELKASGDIMTYAILSTAECMLYDDNGETNKVLEIIEDIKALTREDEKLRYIYVAVLLMMPNFPRYSSLKASEIEVLLNNEKTIDDYWYFKAVEDLGFYYYTLGNYRKSLSMANSLHELLPAYVVPPRLVAMCYYDDGELTVVERKVDEALTFSIENALEEEIHMLYTAKSLIYAYRGEKENSTKYSDLSLQKIGAKDSYEKFFTIMVRIWQHARAGEHAYAHDLAVVYLAYARAKAPEYVPFMLSALGYALFKMGNVEESYQLAKEAIKVGENRSVAWLMCMGIATNYLLYKNDLKEVNLLLTKIIKTASSHGMLRLIVDYAVDVFAPILDYAEQYGIEPQAIAEILSQVRLKEGKEETSASVKINMFGDVYITVNGKELQWKTRKSKDLFLHYILAGDVGIDRNVILDFLWKDYLYESAINNLKTTNNIIRKTLDGAGVKYKINYLNSRYSIKVENLDNDYVRYKMLVENYSKEPEILRKAEIMDDILKIYRADFAMDIAYSDFEHERVSIKQELVINMIKLIRGLAKAGEYVESKRFLNSLMLIDGDNDYNHMVYELDKFINLTK